MNNKKTIKLILLLFIFLILGYFILYNYHKTPNKKVVITNISKNINLKIAIDKSEIFKTTHSINIFSHCDYFLKPIENLTQWRKIKREQIKTLFTTYVEEKMTDDELDYIAKYSGISTLRGRFWNSIIKQKNGFDTSSNINLIFMSKNESEQFIWLFKNKKFQQLISAFNKKQISINKLVYLNYKNLYPLSHILNSEYTEKTVIIRQLIESGAKVTFLDLKIATQKALPLVIVDLLYTASNVDASQHFSGSGMYSSFAVEAVKAGSAELVDYWLSKNSPANPDLFFYNAFDVLKIPKNEQEKQQYLDIFYVLMKYNIHPHFSITVHNLSQWLPNDVQRKYKNTYTKLNTKIISESTKQLVYFKISELYRLVLDGLLVEKGSDNVHYKCFLQQGRKMLKVALDVPKKKTISVSNQVSSIAVQAERFIQTKNLNDLSLDEKLSLFNKNDILNKLARQKILLENLNKKLTSKEKKSTDQEQKMIKSAFTAAKDNWKKTEDIIDSIEKNNIEEKLSMKLMIAIATKQSWDIIKGLIDNGAILSDNTIYILAQSDNVQLARKLWGYGVNIDVIDPTGANVVFICATFNAKSILLFLIEKGIKLNIPTKALDPLDQALLQVKYHSNDFDIIDILIKNGFKIQPSHKEIVANYKLTSDPLYKKLINKFPQLI